MLGFTIVDIGFQLVCLREIDGTKQQKMHFPIHTHPLGNSDPITTVQPRLLLKTRFSNAAKSSFFFLCIFFCVKITHICRCKLRHCFQSFEKSFFLYKILGCKIILIYYIKWCGDVIFVMQKTQFIWQLILLSF